MFVVLYEFYETRAREKVGQQTRFYTKATTEGRKGETERGRREREIGK